MPNSKSNARIRAWGPFRLVNFSTGTWAGVTLGLWSLTDARGRLSTRFVEWMMGLRPGWITAVPGLSRSAQLKALGNGVVPAQAANALRLLLTRTGRS
ncbi:hypothetical protein ACGFYQ_33895 [Streptomyces sp. NPDC048258]|uniref:hypothetical protein n=1 Tax=Streptomyces sp. NPDC048258 TaxID=3365527 RepID=UPI003711C05D